MNKLLLVGASALTLFSFAGGYSAKAQGMAIGVTVEADGNCPSSTVVAQGNGRYVYETSKGALCTSGGGGGGGGAITAAAGSYSAGAFSAGTGLDGWDITEGTKADSAYAGSGSCSTISCLKGIYAALVAALPAGTNLIGKVGIDQTTPGTTNAVQATNFPTTVDTNTGAAGASTLRTVLANNQTITPVPQATGGAGVLCNLALKATATVCDASAGTATDIVINNIQNTVEEDVQLYAVAQGSVTVGTTTVTKCLAVPPGAVVAFPLGGFSGLSFANAITVAVTTGTASACSGTTAPTNNVGVSIDGK